MSQTILVTGGAGYIGSHACKVLARAGLPARSSSTIWSRGHREAVRWGPLVEGDLADRPRLVATLQSTQRGRRHAFRRLRLCRRVGDRAGALLPQQPRRHPDRCSRRCAQPGWTRSSSSSTCATYGVPERSADPPRQRRSSRSTPMARPSSRSSGRCTGTARLTTSRSVSLRYFNAAGADPDGEIGEFHEPETHLIPLVLQAALGQRSHVDIYGTDYPTADGTAIRDYIHVEDLAEAHLRALEYLCAGRAQRGAEPRDGPRSFGARGDRRGRGGQRASCALARCRATGGRPAGPRRRSRASPRNSSAGAPSAQTSHTIIRTALAWHRERAR